MATPPSEPPPERELLPIYGLIAGSSIGVLVAALTSWDIGWLLVAGAGIGLILGAIVRFLTKGS